MELRHLRYFVAVAEELNFTRAAEKLRLAQPSLTRQIRNLEEELGVRLLHRIKNQVSLTDEGKSFLVDAKRLVVLSLESIEAVKRFSKEASGALNVGYLFKFSCDFLPATLKTYYRTCPEMAVNLFDMPPAQQLRMLEARTIDLAFVGLRPSSANHGMSGISWECVAHHNIVVVLPAEHPLAKKSQIRIQELKTEFFVAMSEETHPGSRLWLSDLCKQVGFVPRILQDVELESGMMAFVAEGLGVTLAREQIKNLPHPGVVFRPVIPAAKADYWIAWHRENNSRALLRYIEIVREEAPSWH
jgi:DNA-binding transcriptional LysR family regulator